MAQGKEMITTEREEKRRLQQELEELQDKLTAMKEFGRVKLQEVSLEKEGLLAHME